MAKQFKVKISAFQETSFENKELKSTYLQHRMDTSKLEEWEKLHNRVFTREDVNKEDFTRALFHSYITDEGSFYIPSTQIKGALINAGTYRKGSVGGKTKSLKTEVAGGFRVFPEKIIIPPFDSINKTTAKNNVNKARIVVIRPEWTNWKAEFILVVNNDTLTMETIKELLKIAGENVGIGSWRPLCSGEHGKFQVDSIESL